MHIVPFFGRSIFDDTDMISIFNNLNAINSYPTWLGSPSRFNNCQIQCRKPRQWTSIVKLPGFKPEDVELKFSEDKSKLHIHASKTIAEDEDAYEMKRTISIPETVQREDATTEFTREGVLLIKAPFKSKKSPDFMPFSSWNGNHMNEEMREMEKDLRRLVDLSYPGGTGNFMPQIFHSTHDDSEDKIKLNFDLHGYKPDEIKVEQKDDKISVEATHQSKLEDGSVTSKYFKREMRLPQSIRLNEMTSKLMPDGTLCLMAPCNLKNPSIKDAVNAGEDGSVEVPVNRE